MLHVCLPRFAAGHQSVGKSHKQAGFHHSRQLYQRSADVFLGVPFNIASYALLTHMMAQVCELDVGDFVHTIGDAHLYLNHLEQAKEQITREPLPLPTVKLDSSIMDIDAFTAEHIEVEDYQHHPHIAAPISV